MKIIEPLILTSWLIAILISQFHELTKKKLKKIDIFGFIPNFHLFSPKPFLGVYLIRYKIFDPLKPGKTLMEDELGYKKDKDYFDANRKVVKCINNLCRYLPKSMMTNNNYELLLNFVKTALLNKSYMGEFQFLVFLKTNQEEHLIFKSKIHDL